MDTNLFGPVEVDVLGIILVPGLPKPKILRMLKIYIKILGFF